MTNVSDLGALGPDDKKKLLDVMDAGVRTLQDIKDLQDGLKETIKSVAEELQIKPAYLKKAITVAFKNNKDEQKVEVDTVQDILDVTGRG